MSILVGLFVLFIIFFLVLPILRAALFVHKARQQVRDMFGGGAQRQNREQNERQEPEQPAPRPKKIDPNVGEYVEFEEIKTSSQTTVTDADGTTEYRRVSETVREEQIEDADWEDL